MALFIVAYIAHALAVAGVLVATLTPTARLAVQVTPPYSSDTVYCSCSGGAAYGKGGGISAAARVALSATAATAAPPLARNTQSGAYPKTRDVSGGRCQSTCA
jgi:hypothetical protein